jgi:molybdate transport system ATP-binding protein
MVYVSHSINEVLYLTNHVAMMDHGRLLGSGEFHEVMHDDRVLALAHTLGLENLVRGPVVDHDLEHGYSIILLGQQQLHFPLSTAEKGSEVSVSIPASSIALSRERLNGLTIQNQLSGTVTEVREISDRVLVSVKLGKEDTLLAEITRKGLQDLQIETGSEVYCLFKAQSAVPLIH